MGAHAQTILVVAGIVAFVAAHVGSVLVKYRAPQWLKASVTLVLSVLSGVIPTVSWNAGASWQTYAGAVLAAFVVQMATHASGLTNLTAAATADIGLDSSKADPLDVLRMRQRADGTYVHDVDGATDTDPVQE